MNKLRAIFIFLLLAGAFAFSLLQFGRFFGFRSPWFALDVMLCFLGLVAMARPFYLLPLPRRLGVLQAWETDGRLYRKLGVPQFGTLLRRTPLRFLNRDVYLAASDAARAAVPAQLETAEAAHWGAALLLLPYLLYLVKINWWSALLGMMAVQVFGNVYPILHLRWVRCRLERVANRRSQKPAPTGTR